MADPTLISFSTLFFICQEFTCWFYQKSDNDFNIYLIGFFFRLHTETIIYKEIDRFKTTVFSFLRLTIGLLREATVLL